MSEKTNKNVPELRFKGFSDAWVQRQFFDNVKNVIDFRGRTPLKLGMDWSESGYLALSALNVKNGYIDANQDAHYGGEELYQKWMGNVKLTKGDVLFTTEAPMGNVAQVPDDKGYILSQRTIALQTDDNVTDSTFFAQYLRSSQIQNTLNSVASGGTAKGVSQKTLTPIQTVVPGDVREQRKIGELLVSMDNLIAANQRKLDSLKMQKSAYLARIFNQSLRFSGFHESWKLNKFSDGMFEYTDRVTIQDENDYPQLSISNKGRLSIRGVTNGRKIGRKRQAKINLVEHPNTLVFTRQGVQNGSIGFASDEVDGAIVTENMPTIDVDTTVWDLNYLSAFFNTSQYYKNALLDNIDGGSAQIAIHEDKWIESTVYAPNILEQNKIGKMFSILDELIITNQKKIELLKNKKSAYLQKMFV